MEDTLRERKDRESTYLCCLNPCFNGRYSQSSLTYCNKTYLPRLNPCFNGRYSQRELGAYKTIAMSVLILVLMEDTLRASTLYKQPEVAQS